MKPSFAAGSSLGGVALFGTCVCTFSKVGIGAMTVGGLTLMPFNLQAGLVLLAVALILTGLARRSRRAFLLGLLGFGLIGTGYLLSPPSIMTPGALPYDASQLFGFGLYPLGATVAIAAFLDAFRSANPKAAATSMGGMAMAAGCSCCMVNGALNGLGASAGLGLTGPGVFFTGMGLVAAGFIWMGSARAAALAGVGALISHTAPQIAGLLLAGGARAPLSVSIRFAGLLIVASGFVLAYRAARRRLEARAAATAIARPEAALPTRG
jgi:hypothetical protein